jgi:hypothetical protein
MVINHSPGDGRVRETASKSSTAKPKGYISAFNFFLQKMRSNSSTSKSKVIIYPSQ